MAQTEVKVLEGILTIDEVWVGDDFPGRWAPDAKLGEKELARAIEELLPPYLDIADIHMTVRLEVPIRPPTEEERKKYRL